MIKVCTSPPSTSSYHYEPSYLRSSNKSSSIFFSSFWTSASIDLLFNNSETLFYTLPIHHLASVYNCRLTASTNPEKLSIGTIILFPIACSRVFFLYGLLATICGWGAIPAPFLIAGAWYISADVEVLPANTNMVLPLAIPLTIPLANP